MNIKTLKRLAICAAVFLVVASVLVVFLPIPPHGRFSTPSIGNTAYAYFEASGGKLSLVVFGGERGREGEEYRKFIGDYRKEGGHWVLVTLDGRTSELRATLLSLHIIDPPADPAGPFYRHEVYTGR